MTNVANQSTEQAHMTEINEAIARKLLRVIDACLTQGLGEQMCIEAAVRYALDLPHSDPPGCAAEPLRHLKIRLNDASWSSPAARAAGMRRLALAQLGSAGEIDGADFAKRVTVLTIRVYVPLALRAAAVARDAEHKAALESAALACENEPTRENAIKARNAAANAAAYASDATAAAYASADAARDAAYAAAFADAYASAAADAAADAAYATAAADAADAAYAAAYAAATTADASPETRDAVLAQFAEGVVQILIEMGGGCPWLSLTE